MQTIPAAKVVFVYLYFMTNSNRTLNLDLVSSVLPCAGLSTLNRTNRGQNVEQNMHMLKAAQYVL